MRDDELVRHNEMARAQREAAWSGVRMRWMPAIGEIDTVRELQSRIAAKYPLKRRVRRTAQRFALRDNHVRLDADGRIEFEVGAHGGQWERARDVDLEALRILGKAAQEQPVTRSDAPDVIEDVTTWDE